MSVKVIALITSRINSTRLPNKAMADIMGKPMVQRVYERTKAASLITDVIIATTPSSKPIRELCEAKGMKYFAGSEDDILGRLYNAVCKVGKVNWRFNSKDEDVVVVRVWGDAPLVDPQVLDETIKYYFDNDLNYVTNTGYPWGLNTAVISFGSLQKAHRKIKDPKQREWIHKYFIDNPQEYRVGEYRNYPDASALDWSVDTLWDLEFARLVYKTLGDDFHWKDVLRLLCKAK